MTLFSQQTVCCDVLIVGAGPAGSAAAIILAGQGFKVLMLEKHQQQSVKLGESLPPASLGLVEHFLGDIDKLKLSDIGCYKTQGNISTWAGAEADIADFFFSPKGYGLCINRYDFDLSLQKKAEEHGAKILRGKQFKQCKTIGESEYSWQVSYSDINTTSTQTVKTRYIIDASGRQAQVATSLKEKRLFLDNLFAYAMWYNSNIDDQDCFTRIEACKDGWFYSNRLPKSSESTTDTTTNNSERLVVFHTDKDLAIAKSIANPQGFTEILKQANNIQSLLEEREYSANTQMRGASACSQRLENFAGRAWLAVGDAAQAYDPLSSQGIFKSLDSGNSAGQYLAYALSDSNELIDNNDIYIKRYIDEQEQLWQQYTEQKNYYYQSQPHWQDQPFWQRRQQTSATVERERNAS